LINFKKYWQALRLSEVIMMSGFFIIGSFFAIDEFNYSTLLKFTGLSILSIFIVLSVYSFNAAAGKSQDINNLRLKNLKNLSPKVFYIVSLIFSLLSLILSYILNKYAILLCLTIIVLWIFYSNPKNGLKQKAIYGTLVHFVGQILHFTIAWIIFSAFTLETILIALFFSIAFSSGHIMHEIIDYDADKKSGANTNPIKFGYKNSYISIVLLVIFNSFFWASLFAFTVIDFNPFITFFFPSILHLLILISFIKRYKSNIFVIRFLYRIVYFVGGISYIIIKVISVN